MGFVFNDLFVSYRTGGWIQRRRISLDLPIDAVTARVME
jgi:hypothetical protein